MYGIIFKFLIQVIDAGYDIPKLAKYFDWIAVMTYDYHGQKLNAITYIFSLALLFILMKTMFVSFNEL